MGPRRPGLVLVQAGANLSVSERDSGFDLCGLAGEWRFLIGVADWALGFMVEVRK